MLLQQFGAAEFADKLQALFARIVVGQQAELSLFQRIFLLWRQLAAACGHAGRGCGFSRAQDVAGGFFSYPRGGEFLFDNHCVIHFAVDKAFAVTSVFKNVKRIANLCADFIQCG